MTIKVLVVDDSMFFQRRVSEILNSSPELDVVGVASNGLEAVEKNKQLKPDVITLDYEMPVMDGVTALKEMMRERPVPVLMFSSLTFQGARITLEALEAGAVDFLPKNFDDIAKNKDEIRRKLVEKVQAVAQSRIGSMATTNAAIPAPSTATPSTATPSTPPANRFNASGRVSSTRVGKKDILVIGTSTGGPAALQTLFKAMDKRLNVPVIIVQHMPASFTNAFAERLDGISSLNIKEAQHGDKLQPGHAYLAPGGMQLTFSDRQTICISESDDSVNYRPCVDLTFNSAAEHFADKTLAVVLTGMGADGREGSRTLKAKQADVWTQDEASCVIYGMPMSVETAGLSDQVLPLEEFAPKLMQVFT